MHRLESAIEGRLRAACDRCHDLKNRCVRTGGIDSRCDRCDRLDIDCVYRNTSRIGRPRTQRRTSAVSQPQPPGREGYEDESQSTGHKRVPSKRSLYASGLASEAAGELSGSTTLAESPSDMMNFLVSPEGVGVDMGWSLDFPQINDCIPESQCQDGPRPGPLPASSEAFSFPDLTGIDNAEQTTNRLLLLQGRLHHLLWAADREPTADMVEDSLEVIKTFLEILQAALAAHGQLPADCAVRLTATATATTRLSAGPGMTEGSESVPLKQQPTHPDMNGITAHQALTCYSSMLIMLDRVVNVLTSSDYASSKSSPAALSLGFFNLASQPALQAEVVLHLVLRMVERLRMLIQVLVWGCKDLENRSPISSSGTGTVVDDFSRKRPFATTSIAVSSHAIADLVSEREKLLVERLSYCMSGL